MTTPLLLLRCVELGISIRDLDLITIGLLEDIFEERVRDDLPWDLQASQLDMDKF